MSEPEKFNGLNTTHKTNIDLLRIIAALAIILSHISGEFTLRNYDNGLINLIIEYYGFLSSGVDLFFVISGYVIMLSLNSKYHKPGAFLRGRIRRIIPIYWMLTLTILLLNLVTNFLSISNVQIANFERIISSFFFVTQHTGNSPPIIQQGWTLEYEMLFYLIVFLTMFIQNRKISLFCIFAVILGLGFTSFYLMLEFLGGVIVYQIHKNKLVKNFGIALLILGVLLLVPGVIGIITFEYRLYFVLPYSLILLGVLNVKQAQGSLIVFFGRLSYPMYLVQAITIPLLYQYIKVAENFSTTEIVLIYIIGVFSTLIVSILVLLFFEDPISKKIKSFGW
jgi:exopolysaccharide production protein ExoZ